MLPVLAVLAGCGNSLAPGAAVAIGQADFPYKPGSRWVYAVSDSFPVSQTTATDTLQIRSVSTVVLQNGQTAALWQYAYRNKRTDTLYICLTKDSVWYYDNPDAQYSLTTYALPLDVGRAWSRTLGRYTDTSTVVRAESVTVPAGRFDAALVVVRDEAAFDSYQHSESWLKSGTGLLRKSYYGSSSGSGKVEFISQSVLLEYTIVK